MTGAGDAPALPWRARLARRVTVAVGGTSRRVGLGSGSVIGGRVGMFLDHGLVANLAAGRQVALVTGTNGKTTTTRLLACALAARSEVATSSAGANLPAGVAAALACSASGVPAVLEVDEGYLEAVVKAARPQAVMLLNLSRDQLDRVSEVRMVANRWRRCLAHTEAVVVANADDPLVAWSASAASRTVWVAAGQLWRADAVGCPSCEGAITFAPSGEDWWCACGFRRPAPDVWLDGDDLVTADGGRIAVALALPGRFNQANAMMAATTAQVLGVALSEALVAMATLRDVEGRFAVFTVGARTTRLLLAKNPAGWTELLGMIEGGRGPVVIGINARIADGHDPSWLWDVPFEALAERTVVATGERCRDLAVRLRHAGVPHVTVPDQMDALSAAGSDNVEYIGNYTAFQEMRQALGRVGARASVAVPHDDTSSVVPTSVPARDDGRVERPRPVGVAGPSTLRVVVVHPDLMGTYGDGGNGRVLADRAAWRGMAVELIQARSDMALPSSADLYCIGGGEDGPQVRSAQLLASGALASAVSGGAVVLAVCAGYQVVGNVFAGPDGRSHDGVGLLDVTSHKGPGPRAVGELVADVLPGALPALHAHGDAEALTGFENHSGITRLGADAMPLALVRSGVGNGGGDRTEGARCGTVIGTYLHGPVLARNPVLADMLLALATGATLEPLDDSEEAALRAERLSVVGTPRWRRHAHQRATRATAATGAPGAP